MIHPVDASHVTIAARRRALVRRLERATVRACVLFLRWSDWLLPRLLVAIVAALLVIASVRDGVAL